MEEKDRILVPNEAEAYVEALNVIDICDVGSYRWLRQHQLIYKLSVQASFSAKSKEEEEFVKDLFVYIGKVDVVIHELLLIEIWKEKVFPVVLKINFNVSSIVPLYTVLYHEATTVSLLSVLLFHEDVIESANDVLIDLIDYCNRKLVSLLNKDVDDVGINYEEMNKELHELLAQEESLSFYVAMNTISIISHISQHLKVIPLSVLHRLLNIHDIPMTFVSLLLDAPWKRKSSSGELEKYADGIWRKTEHSETHKLSHVEGQVWITLIQLLLNQDCMRKYDITYYRKSQLLKLKAKITEPVAAQIPLLDELLRFLEHLGFFEPHPSKPDLIIEQVPEIRESLMEKNRTKWHSIAKMQVEKYFSLTKSELDYFYKKLSETYDMDSLEAMLSDKAMCATCHKGGSKKCSRCKNEWYCGRKCQVEHWSKHKPLCDLLVIKNGQ